MQRRHTNSLLVALILLPFAVKSQDTLTKPTRPPYDRKEEVIYHGKLYRVYNNYLTGGAGVLGSSIRGTSQKCIGLDFNWHLRRQWFQTGVMMSGEGYGDNNNLQAHITYGYRRERNITHFAAFIGPSISTGVQGTVGSPAVFYEAYGVYGCVQAVSKLLYDIGFGLEVFGEVNTRQTLYGFKVIAYFSGAYRGLKKKYNPHVRSENQ